MLWEGIYYLLLDFNVYEIVLNIMQEWWDSSENTMIDYYHIVLQELCVCHIKGQCMYITQRWGFNCKSSSHQLHVFDQMKYFVLTRSPLNVGIVISISYRSNAIFLTQSLLFILLEKLKKKKNKTKQKKLYTVMMIHLQFYHDFLNCSSLAEIELIK